MGQTVLWMCNNNISRDLFGSDTQVQCLNQPLLCIQAVATPDVTSYIKMSFAYSLRKLGFVPLQTHMKQDYTEVLFKGKRLTFSCLHRKLKIDFLCCAEMFRPSSIPEAMHLGFIFLWTMWNKPLQSVAGGYSRWLSREGKETLLVSTSLLKTVTHYQDMSSSKSNFSVYCR